jgi:hypothetical protein
MLQNIASTDSVHRPLGFRAANVSVRLRGFWESLIRFCPLLAVGSGRLF